MPKSTDAQSPLYVAAFYRRLLNCPSEETRLLATMLRHDRSSTTGQNLSMIEDAVGTDPMKLSRKELKHQLNFLPDLTEEQTHDG